MACADGALTGRPGRPRGPGAPAVRTAVPTRMASTSASSQVAPKAAASRRSNATAAPVTATQSSRPGTRPVSCADSPATLRAMVGRGVAWGRGAEAADMATSVVR